MDGYLLSVHSGTIVEETEKFWIDWTTTLAACTTIIRRPTPTMMTASRTGSSTSSSSGPGSTTPTEPAAGSSTQTLAAAPINIVWTSFAVIFATAQLVAA